jgi:FixJ family two-component response regulator
MTENVGGAVAVVDDDARVLESTRDLLESAGYSAHAFQSARSFLESGVLAVANCLITDIGMPVMDGFELCRQARATRADLPVIFITGRSEESTQARAMAEGYHGLFRKPFDAAELLASVDQAVFSQRGGSRHD